MMEALVTFGQWLLATAAAALMMFAVMQYRLGQLEKQRVEDQAKNEKARNEIWKAVHEDEKALSAFKEDCYKERLIIERRFSDVALAQANVAGDVRTIKEIVERIERKSRDE